MKLKENNTTSYTKVSLSSVTLLPLKVAAQRHSSTLIPAAHWPVNTHTGGHFHRRGEVATAVFAQLGSVSNKMSLALCVRLSGNLTSNVTKRSPLRLGSFGKGRPKPWMRFTVDGLTISLLRLSGIFSPPSVGTSTIVPHRACNKERLVRVPHWTRFFYCRN